MEEERGGGGPGGLPLAQSPWKPPVMPVPAVARTTQGPLTTIAEHQPTTEVAPSR